MTWTTQKSNIYASAIIIYISFAWYLIKDDISGVSCAKGYIYQDISKLPWGNLDLWYQERFHNHKLWIQTWMYIKQCSNRTLQTIYLSHKYDFYDSCRVATLAQTGYACLSVLRYKDGLLSKWSNEANPTSWSQILLPKCSSPICSS